MEVAENDIIQIVRQCTPMRFIKILALHPFVFGGIQFDFFVFDGFSLLADSRGFTGTLMHCNRPGVF